MEQGKEDQKMKWYKHESSARHDVKIKILMQNHGVEGYGIYFIMLEVIAEYAKENNIAEWGFVDKIHSVETLAAEAGVTPDKLRKVLETCNKLDLFQKKNGRLFCEQILKRLDDYAQKIQRKNKKSEQSPDNVRTNSEQSSARIDKNRTEQNRLNNGKSAEAPVLKKK